MNRLLKVAVVAFALFVLAPVAHAQNPQAALTWTAPSVATPSALTYDVQRSNTVNGTYTSIGMPTAPGFADTNVVRGNTYFYHVYSVCPATGNGCGTTAAPVRGSSSTSLNGSATIPNATVAPPPPSNLTITVQ